MLQLSSMCGVSLGLSESGALRKKNNAIFSILMWNTKNCVIQQHFQIFLISSLGAKFHDITAKNEFKQTMGLCLWCLDF